MEKRISDLEEENKFLSKELKAAQEANKCLNEEIRALFAETLADTSPEKVFRAIKTPK